MRCPYCTGEMNPCITMTYRTPVGLRVAEWVRCTRCRHATIISTHTLPRSTEVRVSRWDAVVCA